MARFPLLLALAGVLFAPAAGAQGMPPPPSMSDPGPGAAASKKPAPKPRPTKPADAGAAAKPAAKVAPQRGHAETLPARKIDPSDIADPYGGVGPSQRAAPTFTPSGRVGVGGKF
jgi:hypothetical protein